MGTQRTPSSSEWRRSQRIWRKDAAGTGGTVGGVVQEYYFSVTSALILVLSLIAFSDNLIWDVGQPSNSDPKFIIHGAFCLAWMIVFVAQANLARMGRIDLHRKLAIAGFGIAIGVTISTIYVFAAIWEGWSAMSPEAKANRFLLPGYALLIFLAWVNRRRPEHHKRMIYMGTLYMLGPILSRAGGHMSLAQPGFFIIVWNGFFISLLLYDWIVARKIHPVTYLGYGCFYVIWTLAVLT